MTILTHVLCHTFCSFFCKCGKKHTGNDSYNIFHLVPLLKVLRKHFILNMQIWRELFLLVVAVALAPVLSSHHLPHTNGSVLKDLLFVEKPHTSEKCVGREIICSLV